MTTDTNYLEVIKVGLQRLTAALEQDGPHGAKTQAIAAELQSAGIHAKMNVGQPPEYFETHPEAAYEWALGSALDILEHWDTIEPGTGIFYAQTLLNLCHTVAETGRWP